MKYKIWRTSSWGYQEEAPCSGAYRGENDEHNYPQWFVDVNTLEDLQMIQMEAKRSLILGIEDIEIYDEHRE